jgi:hypothetical protein
MRSRGITSAPTTSDPKGLRSPYPLSGLITCGRCGQTYQGRKNNAGKRHKDGRRSRPLLRLRWLGRKGLTGASSTVAPRSA